MNRLRKAYGDKYWFQYRRAYHRRGYSALPVFGSGSSAAAAMGENASPAVYESLARITGGGYSSESLLINQYLITEGRISGRTNFSRNGEETNIQNHDYVNSGWNSPEFGFGRVDTGFWVISGTYKIGFSTSSNSSITIFNDGIQIGPMNYDIDNLGVTYTDENYSIPGMSIGLNHSVPIINVEATSVFDTGNVKIEQNLGLSMEARVERPIALSVLAGGYEALLLLLRTRVVGPTSIPLPQP